MDGFALRAAETPGELRTRRRRAHGREPAGTIACRTGDADSDRRRVAGRRRRGRADRRRLRVGNDAAGRRDRVAAGANVVAPRGGHAARRDVLRAGTRIRARRRWACWRRSESSTCRFTGARSSAVLSSGDELVAPSARPPPAQIRDSNRYAIAASLRAMGARPRHYPTIARRSRRSSKRALAAALRGLRRASSITGGSSVGERDRLPAAVAAFGDPGVSCTDCGSSPGKPLVLGARANKPIFGLPGNPASALLVLEARRGADRRGAGRRSGVELAPRRVWPQPGASRPAGPGTFRSRCRMMGGALAHPLPLAAQC